MTDKLLFCLGLFLAVVAARAQSPVVFERGNSTIMLEPYAPNIIRVTLSLLKDQATAAPGYGFVAASAAQGWTRQHTAEGDEYRSDRLIVHYGGGPARPGNPPLPTQKDIGKFFNGSTPGAHITFRTPDGKTLLDLVGWSMSEPNYKDGNTQILHDRRASDPPFFQVGAAFASPADEHYYGLGQNQEGAFDHRGRTTVCAHDYNATGGASVCVPFAVSNYGYGLVWDNPSKTTIQPGFNEQTRWTSEVGQRVSFFVIAGNTTDEIYSGYRLLTGPTPMLPKSAYGFIQCKQRYSSRDELLG